MLSLAKASLADLGGEAKALEDVLGWSSVKGNRP